MNLHSKNWKLSYLKYISSIIYHWAMYQIQSGSQNGRQKYDLEQKCSQVAFKTTVIGKHNS